LLGLLLLVTAVGSVGLGVLVGLATRRVTTTAMLGVNVATASFLLGGGFTTIAFLPPFVQGVARFFPTYYAVEGIREVLFYERMPALGRNLAVLLATAAVSLLARWGPRRCGAPPPSRPCSRPPPAAVRPRPVSTSSRPAPRPRPSPPNPLRQRAAAASR
jgi:hypothetical protein